MLQKLKDYKEFILILVMFLSGAIWIYGIFVTKSRMNEAKCMLYANIELTNSQLRTKVILDEIAALNRAMRESKTVVPPEKEVDRQALYRDLDDAKNTGKLALQRILRDECKN